MFHRHSTDRHSVRIGMVIPKVTAALQSASRYENYHSPIGVPEWCRAAVVDLALTPRVVLLDQNS